jgi:cytoskeletal protein RodZ
MTIETSDTDPVLEEPLPETRTAGALLKAQRIRRGLSEQWVADKLHITMHYVRAIESDNYEKLPGKVFAKGYIRSYALLLELDVDEIVKLYDEFCDFIDEEVEKQDRIVAARNKKDRLLPMLILAIVVLITAILGIWIYIQFFSASDDSPQEAAGLDESGINQVFALQVGI